MNASPVFADEDRVLQVLNELVGNAIKFSPPGTAIRLAAWDVDGVAPNTAAHEGGAVCFMVEDQGRGIAPEKLERIFDRFEQGDASDSRALGGTGLGLALCRSIVERPGGRILGGERSGHMGTFGSNIHHSTKLSKIFRFRHGRSQCDARPL